MRQYLPRLVVALSNISKRSSHRTPWTNRNFAKTKLPMPLLIIEGEKGMNGVLAIQVALISDDVKSMMFPSGHWLMEEKPAETSAAL